VKEPVLVLVEIELGFVARFGDSHPGTEFAQQRRKLGI
jgi:hypothetical protein